MLDQPPYETITAVEVDGAADSPSTVLLAAWLQEQLQVDVKLQMTNPSKGSSGIHGVRLHRASGVVDLERSTPTIATLKQPGQPTHDISLPRRSLRDCLAEELRRLDPDFLFGEVIRLGVEHLEKTADLPAKAKAASGPKVKATSK